MELREFIIKFGGIKIANDTERYWRIIVNCFLVDGLEQVLLEALPVLFKHYYNRFASFNNGELPSLLQEPDFRSICHTKVIQSAVWIQPSDFLQRIVKNNFDQNPTNPAKAANGANTDLASSINNPFIQLAQKEKEEHQYEARFGQLTLEEFSCGICFELLKDAVEGDCCKNLFCFSCVEKYGGKCPNCRKPPSRWTLNEPIRRLISKKPVKCDHENCTIWSTIGEIEKHRVTCEFNPENAIARVENKIELRKKYEQLRLKHITKYAGFILYLTDLDEDINEGQLWSGFSQFYGTMRAARVMTDNRGINTAFIWFTTAESAQKAFEKMTGRVLPGFMKPLQIHLHMPDKLRRRKLMRQHTARTSGRLPNMPQELYKSFNDVESTSRDHVPRRVQHVNRHQSQKTYHGDSVPDGSSTSIYRTRPSGYNNYRGGHRNQYHNRHSRYDNPAPQQQDQSVAQEDQVISVDDLNRRSPAQQHNLLGDLLYARVMKHVKSIKENTQLVAKITGMILDSDGHEGLVELLNDSAALAQVIEDALTLLKDEQYE